MKKFAYTLVLVLALFSLTACGGGSSSSGGGGGGGLCSGCTPPGEPG